MLKILNYFWSTSKWSWINLSQTCTLHFNTTLHKVRREYSLNDRRDIDRKKGAGLDAARFFIFIRNEDMEILYQFFATLLYNQKGKWISETASRHSWSIRKEMAYWISVLQAERKNSMLRLTVVCTLRSWHSVRENSSPPTLTCAEEEKKTPRNNPSCFLFLSWSFLKW